MAKLLKITEMAKRAGVKPSTIRYYTEQGLLRPAKLTPGGHKLYDEKETLARLRKIRGISEKPSLKEAKEILENGGKRQFFRKRMLFAYASLLFLLTLSAVYLNLKKENISFFTNDWRNIYTIEEVKLARTDWRTLETRELDREYLERLEGDSMVRIKRGMSQALAAESPEINYLECTNQKEAKRLLNILRYRNLNKLRYRGLGGLPFGSRWDLRIPEGGERICLPPGGDREAKHVFADRQRGDNPYGSNPEGVILEERCKEHTYLRKGNVVIEIISEYPSLREEVAQRLSR